MRFSQLFANALAVPLNPGTHNCFWCGLDCDDTIPVKVSGTFWDWDAVAYPRSPYQCAGCAEFLVEKREMSGYDKPQKTRNHSWFVSSAPAVKSHTKRDIDELRHICLEPPTDVSWGLAIAESGQKHILYRTPVNHPGGDRIAVQLELLTVSYHPDELHEALVLCARIASVLGKPSLGGSLGVGHAISLSKSGMDPELVSEWNRQWNSPVCRLAAFLCPGKNDAYDYLETHDAGRVPQATGRPERRQGKFGF